MNNFLGNIFLRNPIVKFFIVFLGVLCSSTSYAAGYSAWAVPKEVELVNGGVLISGSFGDPSSCGVSDYVFVAESDSRYDTVVSMVLAALMAKKEIRYYSSKCFSVSFHWAGSVINLNQPGEALLVR